MLHVSGLDIHKFEAVVELMKQIPHHKDLPRSNQSSYAHDYSSQKYTEENCKAFGIPFIKEFVDLDTHDRYGSLRIQGYVPFVTETLHEMTVETLEFLLKVLREGASSDCCWGTVSGITRLEITIMIKRP